MDDRNGFHSARNNPGIANSPRNDRQQPIIIQNFELLTPNQLKFKRKSLSTANLYLSSASLSRQGAWSVQNRPMSEQSPRTGLPEFLENDVTAITVPSRGHQSNGLTKHADVSRGITPSSLSSTRPEKSGLRKHVTFADTLPSPYSLTNNLKMWQASNSVTNHSNNNYNVNKNNNKSGFHSSLLKPNSNNDLDRPVQPTKYGHLSTSDKVTVPDKTSDDLSGTSKTWYHVEQGHLHDTNDHPKMNDNLLTDKGHSLSGQFPQEEGRGLYEGVADDRRQQSEKVINSNNGGHEHVEKDGDKSHVEKDKNEDIDTYKDNNVLPPRYENTEGGRFARNSKLGDKISVKTKNVSFNLPDNDKNETDAIGDKETSASGQSQWYDMERFENSEKTPFQNVGQPKNLTLSKNPTRISKQNTFTALPQAQVVDFSTDQNSEYSKFLVSSTPNQMPNASDVRKIKKLPNSFQRSTRVTHQSPDCTVSLGSKVIRLNFLKDELDIYRREEDPLHPKHQRKEVEHDKLGQVHGMDISEVGLISDGNPEIVENGMNGPNYEYLNKMHQGLNGDEGNTSNKENVNHNSSNINTKTNSNFREIAQLKYQSESNTDFLMQIYSASGERKAANEIVAVSQVNQMPSDKSEQRNERQQVRQVTHRGEEQTRSHPVTPFSFTPRSRERERRLLSAVPMRDSKSLDRPRSRSSSASGLCKGRDAGQGRMSTAERFLFRTDKRTAERTDMNKRLEHLVVSSIQYNRSKSLMARSRTNMM